MSDDNAIPRVCCWCNMYIEPIGDEVPSLDGCWAHKDCEGDMTTEAEQLHDEQVREYNRTRGV